MTNAEVEVVVVFQLVERVQTPKTPEERGWPAGFFEQTAGGWAGEPLVRGDQGEYEEREELSIREEQAEYKPQSDQQ